jgi:tetratricopeptide (TPR) repeat protein
MLNLLRKPIRSRSKWLPTLDYHFKSTVSGTLQFFMSEHHRTLCLVSEYLSELLRSGGTTGLDSEALEVAQQCIADLCATGPRASLKDYGLALPQVIAAGIAALKTQKSTTAAGAGSELQYSEAFLQYLGKLKESGYFGKGDVAEDSAEYKDRVEKAVNKWKSKYGSPYKGHDKEIVVEEVKEQVEVTEEDRKAAEELKASGNKKLAAGDYMGAIQCYSDAIKLNPQQAIYPANRAVAYIKMRKLEEAEKDWYLVNLCV